MWNKLIGQIEKQKSDYIVCHNGITFASKISCLLDKSKYKYGSFKTH
jgi:hypothetical protein